MSIPAIVMRMYLKLERIALNVSTALLALNPNWLTGFRVGVGTSWKPEGARVSDHI